MNLSKLVVLGLLGAVPAPESLAYQGAGVARARGVDAYHQAARAFDPGIDANAEVLIRRVLPDIELEVQYKMSTSLAKGGMVYVEYIHPSTMQGLKLIMDRGELQSYNPSSRVITISKEPWKHELQQSERVALLRKNYAAVYEASTKVAGRDTYQLLLTPRRRGPYVRRVWVDQNALFLLKQDIWEFGQEGQERTVFQALSFRGLEDTVEYRFGANRDVRTVHVESARAVNDPGLAAGLVGFTPPSRVSYPYGVVESGREIYSSSRRFRPLRVKLTDGVANVVLWAWRTDEGNSESLVLGSVRMRAQASSGRVGVYVEGDYPKAAREAIAAAYISAFRTPERE